MLATERHFLWQLCAVSMGVALPFVMLGNSLMYGFLILATLTGLLATKGASLRSSLSMVLNSHVTLLIVALLAWLGCSAMVGVQPSYSLHKASEVLGVTVIAGILFIALREMPGRYTTTLQIAFVLALVFMMAISLLDAFSESFRLSAALHGEDKALTPHRQNFYSSAFAVAIPFLWAHYARRLAEGVPLIKMTAPVVLPLSIFVVMLGGGRAGWVAVVVGLFLFLALGLNRYKLPIKTKQWLGIVATFILGALAYGYTRGWEFLLARLEAAPVTGELTGGSGRLDIWQDVLGLIPWDITTLQFWAGIGPNAFRAFPEGNSLHPHNVVLQLMLETGLIGLLLAAGVFAVLALYFWRWAQGNIFGSAGLAALGAYFASALFSKSIFDVEWFTILVSLVLLGWRLGWSSGVKLEQGSVLNASGFIQTPKVES